MPRPTLTESKKLEIYKLFFSAHCTIVEIGHRLNLETNVVSKYVSELILRNRDKFRNA
jgi:DNA-directed RNA polymerase specialized sigma subunit